MGAFPAPLQSEPPLKGNGIIDQSRGGSLCKEGHLVSPVPLAHSGTDAPPLLKADWVAFQVLPAKLMTGSRRAAACSRASQGRG